MTGLPSHSKRPATAPPAQVAILAALGEELRPLLRRTSVARSRDVGPVRVAEGRLGQAALRVALSGVGPVRASAAAASLLDDGAVSALIVIGTAGGLQPGLPAGAVVVAQRLVDGTVPVGTPDASLVARAVRAGALPGTIVSAGRMLCTAQAKARAWAACGASGPAVVDLESAAAVREAVRRRTPWVVVRAVCDPAEEDLPLDFDRFTDDSGELRRGAVARHALLRPARLPALLDLRRRVLACGEQLARLVRRLLEEEAR